MDKVVVMWGIGLFLTFIVAPTIAFLLSKSFSHGDRLTKIETDIGWIRDSFQTMGKKAVRVLHSPHTPELDDLLEKYEAENLAWHEVNKLYSMLEDILNDPTSAKDMKNAAGILLASVSLRYKGGESEALNK